jgi:hypothetical protein
MAQLAVLPAPMIGLAWAVVPGAIAGVAANTRAARVAATRYGIMQLRFARTETSARNFNREIK